MRKRTVTPAEGISICLESRILKQQRSSSKKRPGLYVGTTLFTPYDTYDPFFKIENSVPGLRRICFVESSDVSASVESAYRNELPFSEITIPANGPVLKAVSLGLMVAIFLALGIVPDVSSAINEQL